MVCPSPSAWRLIERGLSTPLYRVMERPERVIFDAWGPCPCQPGAYLASFVIIRAGYPRTRSVFFKRADSRKYTRHSAPTSRETLSAWLILWARPRSLHQPPRPRAQRAVCRPLRGILPDGDPASIVAGHKNLF